MSRRKPFGFLTILLFCGLAAIFVPAKYGIARPQLTTGQEADDITYTMPAGWSLQPVQAGPEIKAHYVLMSGGRPYGEMYFGKEPLAALQSLDQFFQAGLEKVRPGIPSYRPLQTQRISLAGIDTIVHDFAYDLSGTSWSGRTYSMLVNNTGYTFFFNTLSQYLPSLQGTISQVMASVRPAPKPKPAPQAVGVQAGGQAAVPGAMGGGPSTVEENGLQFDLPAGWAPSNDPEGAKYRLYGPEGTQYGSIFTFEPDELSGLSAMMGGPDNTLDFALRDNQEGLYKKFDQYTPTNTAKIKIGRFDALVHDFTTRQGKLFYRWIFISVKEKEDTGKKRYAPIVHQIAFMTTVMEQLEGLKLQFDGIVQSIRLKGAAAPAAGQGAAPAANLPAWMTKREPAGQAAAAPAKTAPAVVPPAAQAQIPPVKTPPQKAAVEALPNLLDNTQEALAYLDPSGRYTVNLPQGAVLEKKEENSSTYAIAADRTTIQVLSFKSSKQGDAITAKIGAGKKVNGAATNWKAGSRQVTIGLYSFNDAAGDKMASVMGYYRASGLVIVITLPAQAYAGAQDWITALIKGVVFKD
jgi:hypothetical protein